MNEEDALDDLLKNPFFIAMLRKALKENQKEFGERVGVSEYAVSTWERGIRHASSSAKMILKDIALDAKERGLI